MFRGSCNFFMFVFSLPTYQVNSSMNKIWLFFFLSQLASRDLLLYDHTHRCNLRERCRYKREIIWESESWTCLAHLCSPAFLIPSREHKTSISQWIAARLARPYQLMSMIEPILWWALAVHDHLMTCSQVLHIYQNPLLMWELFFKVCMILHCQWQSLAPKS